MAISIKQTIKRFQQNNLITSIQSIAYYYSQYTWIGIFFAMPISRALFHVCIGLTVILTIISGNYLIKINTIKNNPITKPFILLLLIIAIGFIYTKGNHDTVIISIFVYIKIIYMLLFLSIINDIKLIRYALIAFSIAMGITLLSTYLSIGYSLPWSLSKETGLGHSHHIFRDYIVQGIYTSFFSILCAYTYFKLTNSNTCYMNNSHYNTNLLIFNNQSNNKVIHYKLIIIVTYILSIISVLYLLGSRTAYIALLFSNGVFFISIVINQHTLIKKLIFIMVLLLIGILIWVCIYYHSELLQTRVNLMLFEIQNYSTDKMTSTGIRLYMWINAYHIFLQSPIWGHGTGSYPILSKILFNNSAICSIACPHPHNQFLLFAVEHGIIGILSLLYIIASYVKLALQLPILEKALLLGFMAIFIVDCITHGALWLRMESYFFVYMFGLLMAYGHLNCMINFNRK